MKRLLAALAVWAPLPGALLLLSLQKTPTALAWRPLELPLLLAMPGMSLLAALTILKGRKRTLAAAVAGLILVAALAQEARFHDHADRVARAPDEQRRRLGRHFIVGFDQWTAMEALAVNGHIGGIYLSRQNVAGQSVDGVRSRIDRIQALRQAAGRPRLLVTTDQEGGPVSRLSPPLPRQDTLASLLPLAAETGPALRPEVHWAAIQARGLAAMGVNVNFSPVVDLLPAPGSGADGDLTRLSQRAIASDPSTVARVGAAVCRAYEQEGLLATLKHFPGLGRVTEETHLETGRLDVAPEILSDSDWIPFREITRRTRALMMLGHVRLPHIDPRMPAPFSQPVVQGLIRKAWGHDGVLITDDLNMGPAYRLDGGIGAAAVKALNAGVDLLLIAYDPDQYHRAMAAVLRADDQGRLDKTIQANSTRRLDTMAAWFESRRGLSAGRGARVSPEAPNIAASLKKRWQVSCEKYRQ